MKRKFDAPYLDQILAEEEKRISQVKESTFKTQLLPIIANQSSDDADLRIWLFYSGNWRSPINVVDDRSGELLFQVPALVGQNRIVKSDDGYSLSQIIDIARRKIESVPRAGHEYLRDGVIKRTGVEGSYHDHLEQWNAIFRRYGLDHMVVEGGTGTAENEADTDAQDIIDGYDEL